MGPCEPYTNPLILGSKQTFKSFEKLFLVGHVKTGTIIPHKMHFSVGWALPTVLPDEDKPVAVGTAHPTLNSISITLQVRWLQVPF